MLEPFGEVGGDVLEYFSSRTHFSKIEDKKVIAKTQCTSDIDNSVAKRSDTGKTVVYCRTRHLAGKLFLYFIH